MQEYVYQLEFKVRDYECNRYGDITNATFQYYIEHTIHEFLKEKLGFDFAKLHLNGVDPVVYKIDINYINPLKSGDSFFCRLNMGLEGCIRVLYFVDIYQKAQDILMCSSEVVVIILKDGKPKKPEFFYPEFRQLEYLKKRY